MIKKIHPDNETFITKAEDAFQELFELAKDENELHFSFSLCPEFRPFRYNTAVEADIAFEHYLHFLSRNDYPELRPRVALSFYCHLAEASGYWEIIKNMLCVANGERYNVCPFKEFVNKHQATGSLILPNANKIFKSLAAQAKHFNLPELVEVLKDAYNPDLRNAFAHADYVLLDKGIALKNRYDQEYIMHWNEFEFFFQRGINFYHCLKRVVNQYLLSYQEKKIVKGRLADEPECEWGIYYSAKSGLVIGNDSYCKLKENDPTCD